MLLALAFGYLALAAVRNVNLFALVAGFVLGWNVGEWTAALLAELDGQAPTSAARVVAASMAIRIALCGLIGAWIVSIVSGRFFAATGEQRAFGWHESPLAYAHAAARFAGRPGLPERALALDLRQAGVYFFHNGPKRKLYIDGRLEVPALQSFEVFVRTSDACARDVQAGPNRYGEWAIRFCSWTTKTTPAPKRRSWPSPAGAVSITIRSRRSLFPRVRTSPTRPFRRSNFAARHFRDPVWQAVAPLPWGIGEARSALSAVNGTAAPAPPGARLAHPGRDHARGRRSTPAGPRRARRPSFTSIDSAPLESLGHRRLEPCSRPHSRASGPG